jgi:hypothetical protein
MKKLYSCYLAQVTTHFRRGPETKSTNLTKHGRELAIHMYKTQTKSENHETYQHVMISYIEAVIKI